jgi:hypothetical protein
MTWLDDDLRGICYGTRFDWDWAGALLKHLADDRRALTRLVVGIGSDPERRAASRVTLLLDRLCLVKAPGLELRLNLHPRPDNQLLPHDHSYDFATRVLRGGYVHMVRRRTDCGHGPFRGRDLQPGMVTFEHPGSGYGLGHPMVHQAVMQPGTVSLMLCGPRMKEHPHAARDVMPPTSTLPTGSGPGPDGAPTESRPMSFEEYVGACDELVEQGVIDSGTARQSPCDSPGPPASQAAS